MGVSDEITKWGLGELTQKFKRAFNPVYRPVDRFRSLIKAHGLALPTLLRFVPKNWGWSLEHMGNDAGLLRSLDTEKLAWFADWFGVKLDWLEGSSEQIYSPIWFYKDLESLPKELARRHLVHEDLEIVAFTDARQHLERNDHSELAVVFSVPIAEVGETQIRRFAISGDTWVWNHPPCRYDLKLLARTSWLRHKISIPIIPVSKKILESIYEGRRFPAPEIPFSIGRYGCLEDYALTAEESKIARDTEELSAILKDHGDALDRLFPIPKELSQ